MRFVFAFDVAKSHANKTKHGVDFVEAQALWDDENLIRLEARTEREQRFIFVGRIGESHWSAVATYRAESIRIISVRRSRAREVQVYEGD